ncbi:hypothetical protein HDU78_011197 [Chytriomyces hyalinus]|nr:hypothetical protein HDU78_011197 [Chytriomyces hyalinus]
MPVPVVPQPTPDAWDAIATGGPSSEGELKVHVKTVSSIITSRVIKKCGSNDLLTITTSVKRVSRTLRKLLQPEPVSGWTELETSAAEREVSRHDSAVGLETEKAVESPSKELTFLSAADAFQAVPGQTYMAARSVPAPIPTGCYCSTNGNLHLKYKQEYHFISRIMYSNDETLFESLVNFFKTHQVVTPSDVRHCCKLAGEFAASLSVLVGYLDQRNTTPHVTLFRSYLVFVARMVAATDCLSYKALRKHVLLDILGVVFAMLFDPENDAAVDGETCSRVILASLKRLVLCVSDAASLNVHSPEFSSMAVSHVWGDGPNLAFGGEESLLEMTDMVTLAWPEGGMCGVNLQLLQKSGRLAEAIKAWPQTEAPLSVWFDALELNHAVPSFKANNVGHKNYSNGFVVFTPNQSCQTIDKAIDACVREQPWNRTWIRIELLNAAEYSLLIPSLAGNPFLPIEIAAAISLISKVPALKRTDFWDLCLMRSAAFSSSQPFRHSILSGSNTRFPQDLAIAALNLDNIYSITVANLYAKSYEQTLREFLLSEQRNAIIGKILAAGFSHDSRMFDFSKFYQPTDFLGNVRYQVSNVENHVDGGFQIQFKHSRGYFELRSEPQNRKSLMEYSDSIRSLSYLASYPEHLVPHVHGVLPKIIERPTDGNLSAFLQYKPSTNAIVAYLGAWNEHESDELHIWVILEPMGVAHAPIGLYVSIAKPHEYFGGATYLIRS